MKSENTKKILVAVILLGVVLILGFAFLSDYRLPINFDKNTSFFEEKYGIDLNLPEDWTDVDCSESTKVYLKEFSVVCRWSSPPHPESGQVTVVYLFSTDKDLEISSEDITEFAHERQSYGWEGEMERNPNILVELDENVENIYYRDFSGVRLDDYVEFKDSNTWRMWSSIFIPIKTAKANLILQINHIDDRIFPERVYYTAIDILQNVKILN